MTTDLLIRPIIDALSGVLRPRGYRRRGSTFWRDIAGIRHLVNLQRSASSTALEARFTLNLGVLCPTVLASWDSEFSVWSAPWRERIGGSISFFDEWWRVSSEEEARIAAEEILRLLNSALQVLERIDSVPALIEALRVGGSSVAVPDTIFEKYIEKLEGCK